MAEAHPYADLQAIKLEMDAPGSLQEARTGAFSHIGARRQNMHVPPAHVSRPASSQGLDLMAFFDGNSNDSFREVHSTNDAPEPDALLAAASSRKRTRTATEKICDACFAQNGSEKDSAVAWWSPEKDGPRGRAGIVCDSPYCSAALCKKHAFSRQMRCVAEHSCVVLAPALGQLAATARWLNAVAILDAFASSPLDAIEHKVFVSFCARGLETTPATARGMIAEFPGFFEWIRRMHASLGKAVSRQRHAVQSVIDPSVTRSHDGTTYFDCSKVLAGMASPRLRQAISRCASDDLERLADLVALCADRSPPAAPPRTRTKKQAAPVIARSLSFSSEQVVQILLDVWFATEDRMSLCQMADRPEKAFDFMAKKIMSRLPREESYRPHTEPGVAVASLCPEEGDSSAAANFIACRAILHWKIGSLDVQEQLSRLTTHILETAGVSL